SNRGKTWSAAETPMHPANASSGIFSLAFWDTKEGVAVGGDYAHPESSDLPNVIITNDGGRSWHLGERTDPAGLYLSSVAVLPRTWRGNFVAAGNSGMIFFVGRQHRMVDESLNSIMAIGDPVSDVWAVGPKGRVYEASFEHFTKR